MNQKCMITVGRQLGSGGRIVAEQLAQRLQIGFYDKELIQRASSESGLATEFFEQADEKINTPLSGSLLMDFFQDNYFSNESLFRIQSDVIREIAERESAVIVGRCADYVLRHHPLIIRLFIAANTDDRVQRLCQYQSLTPDKALALIEKTDKRRAAYYNYYSSKDWGAAASYDLCINSSVLGLERTIDYLMDFIQYRLQPHAT